MSYQVMLDTLRLSVCIGVSDEERSTPQIIECHCTITLQSEQALRSDAISDTLHYGDLAEHLVAHAARRSYRLLEKLANDLLDAIEAFYPVECIDLQLIKRNPMVLKHLAGAGVRVKRFSQHA